MNNIRFIDFFNGTHVSRLQTVEPGDSVLQGGQSGSSEEADLFSVVAEDLDEKEVAVAQETEAEQNGIVLSGSSMAGPKPLKKPAEVETKAPVGPWKRAKNPEVEARLAQMASRQPPPTIKSTAEALMGYADRKDSSRYAADFKTELNAARSQEDLRRALEVTLPARIQKIQEERLALVAETEHEEIGEIKKEADEATEYCTDLYALMEQDFAATTEDMDQKLDGLLDAQGRLDQAKLNDRFGKKVTVHHGVLGESSMEFSPDMDEDEIEEAMRLQEMSMRAQKRGNEESELNGTTKKDTHFTPAVHMAYLGQAKMRLGLPAHFGDSVSPNGAGFDRSAMHDTHALMQMDACLRTDPRYVGASVDQSTLIPNDQFVKMRTDLFCMSYGQGGLSRYKQGGLSAGVSQKLIEKCSDPNTIIAMTLELQRREDAGASGKLSFIKEKALLPSRDKPGTYVTKIYLKQVSPDEAKALRADGIKIIERDAPDPKEPLKVASRNKDLMVKVSAAAYKRDSDKAIEAARQAPPPPDETPKEAKARIDNAGILAGGQKLRELYEISSRPTKAWNERGLMNKAKAFVRGDPTSERLLASMTPEMVQGLMRAYSADKALPVDDPKHLTAHECTERQLAVLQDLSAPGTVSGAVNDWQTEKHFQAALSEIDDPALLQALYLSDPSSSVSGSMAKIGSAGAGMDAFFAKKTVPGRVKKSSTRQVTIDREEQQAVYFKQVSTNAATELKSDSKLSEGIKTLKSEDKPLSAYEQGKLAFEMEFLRTQSLAQKDGAAFQKYKATEKAIQTVDLVMLAPGEEEKRGRTSRVLRGLEAVKVHVDGAFGDLAAKAGKGSMVKGLGEDGAAVQAAVDAEFDRTFADSVYDQVYRTAMVPHKDAGKDEKAYEARKAELEEKKDGGDVFKKAFLEELGKKTGVAEPIAKNEDEQNEDEQEEVKPSEALKDAVGGEVAMQRIMAQFDSRRGGSRVQLEQERATAAAQKAAEAKAAKAAAEKKQEKSGGAPSLRKGSDPDE